MQADVLNRGRLVSCVLTTQTRKDEPSYPTAPTNKQGEYGPYLNLLFCAGKLLFIETF